MSREECLALIKSDERMWGCWSKSIKDLLTTYKRSGHDVIETQHNADGTIHSVILHKNVLA